MGRRYTQTVIREGDHAGKVVEVDLWGARRRGDQTVVVPIWPFHPGHTVPPVVPVTDLNLPPDRISSLRFPL